MKNHTFLKQPIVYSTLRIYLLWLSSSNDFRHGNGERHYIWWCISKFSGFNTYAKGGKMITPEQIQLLAFRHCGH